MTGYEDQVRDYLAYCKQAVAQMKAAGSFLDPKYHPTEAGALKLIFHRTPEEAEAIRQAYRGVLDEATRGEAA